MIVAVAVENNQVYGHFGHSPSFSFYEVDNGKIISSENIKSLGKGHGILPDFIANHGAKVVIVGGIGAGAVNACKLRGIEIITGVSGNVDEVIELFAKGELKSTEAVCSHHHSEDNHNCSHSEKCKH